MDNIRQTIRDELRVVEDTKGVRILFATESGSRMWGFPSKDSDYDVRFVYARTLDSYLSLEKRRDTIEWMIDDEMDIVGWDLSKFLQLMRRSNPTVFEWLGAPDPYLELPEFLDVREVSSRCFDATALARHYAGMARHHDLRYIQTGQPTPKRYLYAVRATLAARWMCQRREPVPMLFEKLKEAMLEEHMLAIIDGLVVDKICGVEKGACDNIPQLDEWLETSLADVDRTLDHMKKGPQCPFAELDEVFTRIIKKEDPWATK